ncbi:MAG: hypothetical protein M9894_12715 [Planctomycetes bacterium]|nr:hypothetical protein [Planctomycetota bacterium]
MSPSPVARIVARTLARARLRLALRRAVVRAGWALLAGVLLLEVGLAAGAALEVRGAWLPGALALVLAPALLVATRRPSPEVAAAVLDARLGTGAALATAAEALEGRHGRFTPVVLAEAERALVGRSLRQALPVQAPAGLLLGAAAAALLPAVLAGRSAAATGAARPGEAPAVVGLDLRAGGGEVGGPDGSVDGSGDAAPAGPGERAALAPAPDAVDPLGALPPRGVAAVLRERLDDALRALPPGAAAGAQAEAGDDLAAALRAGDAAAAPGPRGPGRRLPAPNRVAWGSVRASGAGGGGGGEAAAQAPGASEPGIDASRRGGAARARLPRELELTSRRYFEASPGAPR